MITFGNYKYIIYIGIISAIVLILFLIYTIWKERIISLFKNNSTGKKMVIRSNAISWIKSILIILAIILSFIIILRPKWGEKISEVNSEGSDLVIALDVSRSMLSRDLNPNRLERAKNSIKWIANSLQGDRIGLILFAGDAFLQCPLTKDIGAFLMFLDAADTDSIKLQGTDIGKTLEEAEKLFTKKRLTTKMLVLITDGEDHEGKVIEGANHLKKLGVSIYTIGVGTNSGEKIPAGDNDPYGDIYVKNNSGTLVKSKKNTALLKQISSITGGEYIDITKSLSGLNTIINIVKKQNKNNFGNRIIREKEERFQIFTLILVLILLFEISLNERNHFSIYKKLKRKKS